MIHKTPFLLAVSVTVICVGLAQFVMAQSGRRSTNSAQEAQGSATRAKSSFEARFWSYLKEAQYRNWASLPGAPTEGYPGNSPHGMKVKLYANRTATANKDEFGSGSILIKENFDASGEKLMAVTVMYRSKGFAPDSGDWYWAKYEPDGNISMMNKMPISGRVGMCIDCHSSAGGKDFVFANDKQ